MPRAAAFVAESTPPPPTTTDYVSALPSWMLVALLILVAAVIAAMFILTFYNLSAPRSTLKNLLGLRRADRRNATATRPHLLDAAAQDRVVGQPVIEALSMAARVGKRTTRTTLAITGFALLGVALVAVFGISGQGMREIRGQVVTAIITLVAAIAGFYFGSESAARGAGTGGTGVGGGPVVGGPGVGGPGAGAPGAGGPGAAGPGVAGPGVAGPGVAGAGAGGPGAAGAGAGGPGAAGAGAAGATAVGRPGDLAGQPPGDSAP
jgi:hypothetical protein